ncbi:MAG: TRAP transporter small permease [Oscillospiraceae bacterium]
MFKIYHKFARGCYQLLRIMATITVVAMLVLMLVEVVRRYCFGKTFIWSDEIIRYLLMYCTFLGGAAAYYQKALVSFDLVTSHLPRKAQEILKLVNNVICLFFFAFLIRYAIKKVTGAAVVKSISTSSGLSLAVPYWAIPIGLIFMFIFTIDFFPELIGNVRAAFRKDSTVIAKTGEKEGGEAC